MPCKSIETIKAIVKQLQTDNDDVDDELFMTAYALALWEIGQLDEELLSQVELAIRQGAFTNYLTQSEGAPNEARQRQQVLERFWAKINQPASKVRKRKIYKTQKHFVFQEGSVLTFQLPGGSYRATILLLIEQYRGSTSYFFTKPTYTGLHKPTLEEVSTGEIIGRMYAPPDFPHSRIRFDVVGIGHKQLRSFAGKFELIDHLDIKPSARCCGTQEGAVNFESFASSFSDFNSFLDVKMTAKTHPKKVFPVQKLL